MAKNSHKIHKIVTIKTMKIGVLSDTHIHSLKAGITLAEKLLSGPFSDVDVVLHAGDHVLPELASCFYPLPWYGVQGNMDCSSAALPLQRVVQLGGFSIAMTTGGDRLTVLNLVFWRVFVWKILTS